MTIRFEQEAAQDAATCPVCDAPIPDMRQALVENHHGQLLAFDRQECLKDFLEDPERYLLALDEEEE